MAPLCHRRSHVHLTTMLLRLPEFCMAAAREYTLDRKQFGAPLAWYAAAACRWWRPASRLPPPPVNTARG